VLEPVEVHRVYPLVSVDGANAVAVPDRAPPDSATDALVAELRGVVAHLRQEHERALGDLQRDRDEWREQAKRLALGAPVAPAAPKVSLWRWLRSSG